MKLIDALQNIPFIWGFNLLTFIISMIITKLMFEMMITMMGRSPKGDKNGNNHNYSSRH